MTLLQQIYKKYIQYKFKRDNLNIIENIPALRFDEVVLACIKGGWETDYAYLPFSRDVVNQQNQWQCKLRKGTSTLICQWKHATSGSIRGPKRIVKGLGSEFELGVSPYPSI